LYTVRYEDGDDEELEEAVVVEALGENEKHREDFADVDGDGDGDGDAHISKHDYSKHDYSKHVYSNHKETGKLNAKRDENTSPNTTSNHTDCNHTDGNHTDGNHAIPTQPTRRASASLQSQPTSISSTNGVTWLAYWNDKYDRHYYYNPATSETTWVMPDNFDGDGAKGKGRDYGFGGSITNIVSKRKQQQKQNQKQSDTHGDTHGDTRGNEETNIQTNTRSNTQSNNSAHDKNINTNMNASASANASSNANANANKYNGARDSKYDSEYGGKYGGALILSKKVLDSTPTPTSSKSNFSPSPASPPTTRPTKFTQQLLEKRKLRRSKFKIATYIVMLLTVAAAVGGGWAVNEFKEFSSAAVTSITSVTPSVVADAVEGEKRVVDAVVEDSSAIVVARTVVREEKVAVEGVAKGVTKGVAKGVTKETIVQMNAGEGAARTKAIVMWNVMKERYESNVGKVDEERMIEDAIRGMIM
jgi:hypothetical protein